MIAKLNYYDNIKFYENYQLKLPMEMDVLIPEDDSVRLLNLVLEACLLLQNDLAPYGEKCALETSLIEKSLEGYIRDKVLE